MLAQVGLLVCLFASAGIGGHRVGLFGGFSGDVGVVCQGRALTRELHDAGPEAHQGPPGREQGRIRASLCCALGTGGGQNARKQVRKLFVRGTSRQPRCRCRKQARRVRGEDRCLCAVNTPWPPGPCQEWLPDSPLAPRALSGMASRFFDFLRNIW